MDAANESEKICKMKRPVLTEYIADLTTTHQVSAVLNMRRQFRDLRRIGAKEVFVTTMKDLFDKLQSRLDETVGDIHQEGITNIETVMAGNISTADFTALFLVHQHMVRQEKLEEKLEPASYRNAIQMYENLQYKRYVKGFKQWLSDITVRLPE